MQGHDETLLDGERPAHAGDLESVWDSIGSQQEAPSDASPDQTDHEATEAPSDDAPADTDADSDPSPDDDTAPEDAPTDDASDDIDPSTLQPLTYTVDGQQRTFDGISVVPGQGAIVAEAAVPQIIQRLSERDHLFEKSQQQYRQYQDLERLTQWTTKGPNGQETQLKGADGIKAMRTDLARKSLALDLAFSYLESPDKLVSLIASDDQGNFVFNPQAREQLITAVQLAAMRGEQTVQQELSQLATQASEPAQINWKESAPTVVESLLTEHKIQGLSDADKRLLSAALPTYVRPWTPEDGLEHRDETGLVIDRGFLKEMQDLVADRSKGTQAVTSATKVAQQNTARLQAAQAGKHPQKSNTPPRDRQTGRFVEQQRPKQQRVTDALANDEWPEFAGSRAI